MSITWEKLQTLLDECLALDAPARQARLESLRASDPELARELGSLLAQETRAERIQPSGAWDATTGARAAVRECGGPPRMAVGRVPESHHSKDHRELVGGDLIPPDPENQLQSVALKAAPSFAVRSFTKAVAFPSLETGTPGDSRDVDRQTRTGSQPFNQPNQIGAREVLDDDPASPSFAWLDRHLRAKGLLHSPLRPLATALEATTSLPKLRLARKNGASPPDEARLVATPIATVVSRYSAKPAIVLGAEAGNVESAGAWGPHPHTLPSRRRP